MSHLAKNVQNRVFIINFELCFKRFPCRNFVSLRGLPCKYACIMYNFALTFTNVYFGFFFSLLVFFFNCTD